jgi:nicotinamidase-related amidase
MDDRESRRSSAEGWRDGLERWPRALPRFVPDRDRAALVVVDMQNLFIDPDLGIGTALRRDHPDLAAYYFDRLAREVVPNNRILLDAFRSARRPVIFTTVGPEIEDLDHYLVPRLRRAYEHEQAEGRRVSYPRGTREHAVIDALRPRPTELVLNKITQNTFTTTGLDQILRNLRVTDLFFTGVATNQCVELTSRDAADRGYRCVVVEDACATYDETVQHAVLRNFARTSGMVMATADVLAALGIGAGGAPRPAAPAPAARHRSQSTVRHEG